MINEISNEFFSEILEKKKDLYFIQIGANNGVAFDPLNELIKRNGEWSGVLFEPGVDAFEELKITYNGKDKLILVNAAVLDVDGKATLYCGSTTPHFTMDRTMANRVFDITPKEVEVDVLSPKSIVNNYNIQKIDLLQVDTEGRDFTIVKAFLENGIYPEIIRFEFIHMYYENYNTSDAVQYLESHGYNCFFVKNDVDIVAIKN